MNEQSRPPIVPAAGRTASSAAAPRPDAQAAFAMIEQALAEARPGGDAPEEGQDPQPDPARARQIAHEFGQAAMRCVSATFVDRRHALIASSADTLQALVALWAQAGVAPDEIWMELHKREQLGSLLMRLNQAQSRAPRRLLKPWRVDSTKLP